MSKSSYVLKIQKDNTIYTCDLYTTQEEARSTIYPTYRLFKVNINGQTLYAPFTKTLDSARESTPLICPIFENDNDLTKYCLAQKSLFKINITTAANETITVTAEGTSWSDTDSHWFPYGTTWTASVAGATGYNAGALSPGSSGTLTNANVTVTAGAASLKTFVLTLAATSHQTIKIQYQPRNADGTMGSWTSDIASGSSAKTYTLRYGSKYKITSFAAATGWNAGTLKNGSTNVTASTSTTYTFTGAITVSATAATHKTYTITLTQKANETVTIHYKNHNGTSLATSWSTKTSSVTLGHGSQYYCTIAASTGYTAGTITSPGTASSPNTLTAAKTISFTAATLKDWTVKIQVTDLIYSTYPNDIAATVKYNQSGTTKTLNIKAETTYTIYVRHNTKLTWTYNGRRVKEVNEFDEIVYHQEGTFYINNSSGTRLHKMDAGDSWTGAAITANTTFKCDDNS